MKKKCVSNIGGQAIIEGVMMRGPSSMAMAVRNSEGEITVESKRIIQSESRKRVSKVPIIRGIVSFFESFVSGIKITTRSAEVFGDEIQSEPSKFEKWMQKHFKMDLTNVAIAISTFLGIVLAVALFVIIPQVIALAIFQGAHLLEVDFSKGVWNAFQTSTISLGFGWNVLYELIRGVARIVIFISYILLISLQKDVKRLFQYHGAEHKVISCFENGKELTVENAKEMTRQHDRCGTTFMFIVVIFSILFFTVVPVSMISVGNGVLTFIVQFLIRLCLIPILAGISYELLKLFAKYDNVFTKICKAPGLWLQKITTREPDDSMLEVSLTAFKEVMELEKNPEYETKSFNISLSVQKAVDTISKIVNKDDINIAKAEAELILMSICKADKKSDLYDGRRITFDQMKYAKLIANNRMTGAPLQYVIGQTNFYGYDFKTDARALIPRMDSEILAKTAIDIIKTIENPVVLDLCTGSGCLGITIQKETNCTMFASDVSIDALHLAKENANALGANVEFKDGSLFMPFVGQKFDVIVCNPPYIPTSDINQLDPEVKNYEPKIALDGGQDGLDFYRDIIQSLKSHLNLNGYIIFEVGYNQADDVKKLLGNSYIISSKYDLNNPPIERVIIGQLTSL
ncbi:MAG: peptide chain release factor N(5)-glutamine methyltransferase [Clostridia bacterium]|nr:peptide chain release factor N(5)-glutamine methyltransferase [Clostridia bacterium]